MAVTLVEHLLIKFTVLCRSYGFTGPLLVHITEYAVYTLETAVQSINMTFNTQSQKTCAWCLIPHADVKIIIVIIN